MKTIKSVITADIVNSTLLSQQQMITLRRAVESLLRKRKAVYSFYRGDSFNAVCEPEEALLIVCLLRTIAIQVSGSERKSMVDIRFAIGIGTIEEPYEELSAAKGEAFILSGREMDQMEKDGPRLLIRCSDAIQETGLAAIARFTDFLIRKLTVKQAQIVHEFLIGKTQINVAAKLHKSQSTISKHANAADWKQLEYMIELYRKMTAFIPSSKNYATQTEGCRHCGNT